MHLSISDAAAAVTVIGAVVAVGGWALHKLLRHMVATGRVATTEASVLWEQAQDMRRMLLDQLKAAETQLTEVSGQRDRLIEAYTHQVLPMLTDMSLSLQVVATAVSDQADKPQGGGHALVTQEDHPPG